MVLHVYEKTVKRICSIYDCAYIFMDVCVGVCGCMHVFFMCDLEVGTLCSSASAQILIELEFYYEC